MNWDDPTARFRLIDSIGLKAYNAAMEQHIKDSTVAVVNGYPIRPIGTARYGRIYMVDGTKFGYADRAKAEEYAASLPPRVVAS